MPQSRVLVYVDGFNLYYGIREKGWKDFFWIDPYALGRALVQAGSVVEGVKYFTARVKAPTDKRDRQTRYLDAVRAIGDTEIILGRLQPRWVECRGCGSRWSKPEEKMTDSAIAAHLVADAFLDRFDAAILIGGDTDIVPAVRLVRAHFPHKTLTAWFPPRRTNGEVEKYCHASAKITGEHLARAVMPDTVQVADGVYVSRPSQWSRRQ